MLGPLLSADEADTFETSVVPRYLAYFGSLAAEMLIPCEPAQIVHLGCRTGYPDAVIADKVPNGSLVGVDGSVPAIELAQAKASLHSEMHATYKHGDALPTSLPETAFTHAYTIHPICNADGRAQLLT